MFTIVASSATISWATATTARAGHRVSGVARAVRGGPVVGVDMTPPTGMWRNYLRFSVAPGAGIGKTTGEVFSTCLIGSRRGADGERGVSAGGRAPQPRAGTDRGAGVLPRGRPGGAAGGGGAAGRRRDRDAVPAVRRPGRPAPGGRARRARRLSSRGGGRP